MRARLRKASGPASNEVFWATKSMQDPEAAGQDADNRCCSRQQAYARPGIRGSPISTDSNIAPVEKISATLALYP